MPLESLQLDDLRWHDLVKNTRGRVAAASEGRWTLHAAVDPGITLLELFAWLLEQRSYWVDQVPDAMVLGLLQLLGDRPLAATSAAAVMQLGPPDAPPPALRIESLRFSRLVEGGELHFTSSESVALIPTLGVQLQVGNRDRSSDLASGHRKVLLLSEEEDGRTRIVLELRDQLEAKLHGGWLSLFIELDAARSILPQWHPKADDFGEWAPRGARIPPPADVRWAYSAAGGRWQPFQPEDIDDGTRGFRRPGIVRLRIPADWAEDEDTGALRPHGGRPYSLTVAAPVNDYSAPPRIRRLVPNVCIARHVREEQLSFREQRLPLPDFTIHLPEDKCPPLEERLHVELLEERGWNGCWRLVSDLAFHGPDERVFVLDRRAGVLRFGDGMTGRLPVLKQPTDENAHNVKVRWRVGGGEAGNVGDNLRWRARLEDEQMAGIDAARNIVPAVGGSEQETAAEARQRIASSLSRNHRAVTQPDYEEIARDTAGLGLRRAHAAIGLHPLHRGLLVPGAVTVFVVPEVPRDDDPLASESAHIAAPAPDAGALAWLRQRFEAARLAGSQVFVARPVYRAVSLRVVLEGEPADPEIARRAVTERLHHFMDPLTGGSAGQGWPFGERVRPTALLAEAQAALTDGGNVIQVDIWMDGKLQPPCQDVRIEAHELAVLEAVEVELRPQRGDPGGLR